MSLRPRDNLCAADRSGRTAHGGFTLLELLVALAVAAVILAFAVPNFSAQVRQSREASLGQAFANAVQWSRMQAMTSGQPTALALSAGCTWTADAPQYGMTVAQFEQHYPDTPCVSTPATLSFSADGLLSGSALFSPGDLQFQVMPSGAVLQLQGPVL